MSPIDVTLGSDAALVHLPSGVVGVRTPEQAHEYADAFREAAYKLEQREHEMGAARDAKVARLLNAAFRTHNVTKPGTVTPTTTVFINACACQRSAGCEVCDPEDAA